MLIFDSVANQCIEDGPAWNIAYYTDKSVNYYNYIKDNNNPIVYQLPIIRACTVITLLNSSSFIALVYEIIYNKN